MVPSIDRKCAKRVLSLLCWIWPHLHAMIAPDCDPVALAGACDLDETATWADGGRQLESIGENRSMKMRERIETLRIILLSWVALLLMVTMWPFVALTLPPIIRGEWLRPTSELEAVLVLAGCLGVSALAGLAAVAEFYALLLLHAYILGRCLGGKETKYIFARILYGKSRIPMPRWAQSLLLRVIKMASVHRRRGK